MFFLANSGTEWASALEVICNVAFLISCVKGHVVGVALLSPNLNVNLGQLVNRKSFALILVEAGLALISNLVEASGQVLLGLSVLNFVNFLEEGVVFLVGGKLDWVLVVGEQ